MKLSRLFFSGSTPQAEARRNNLRRLITVIRDNPQLPIEKAIETYLPKKKWPKSFSKFIQRNKAMLEAILKSKPEMGVEITFKKAPDNLTNWTNFQRLVVGQTYEVHQEPDTVFKGKDFTARLQEKYNMLGYPYLIFEDGKKIDVCLGNVVVKAV